MTSRNLHPPLKRPRVCCSRSSQNRAGFSMLELIVSAVLLTALMSMLAPMLSWVNKAESINAQRQAAVEHLNNTMEQVAGLSTTQRTQPTVEALLKQGLDELSLPSAESTVTLENETDPPGQRVQLSITWSADQTSRTSPVRLSAWFY